MCFERCGGSRVANDDQVACAEVHRARAKPKLDPDDSKLRVAIARSGRPNQFEQLSRLNVKSFRELPDDLQACVESTFLQLAQVAPTDLCLICEVVLRHAFRMAQTPQIPGENFPQIHAGSRPGCLICTPRYIKQNARLWRVSRRLAAWPSDSRRFQWEAVRCQTTIGTRAMWSLHLQAASQQASLYGQPLTSISDGCRKISAVRS